METRCEISQSQKTHKTTKKIDTVPDRSFPDNEEQHFSTSPIIL